MKMFFYLASFGIFSLGWGALAEASVACSAACVQRVDDQYFMMASETESAASSHTALWLIKGKCQSQHNATILAYGFKKDRSNNYEVVVATPANACVNF